MSFNLVVDLVVGAAVRCVVVEYVTCDRNDVKLKDLYEEEVVTWTTGIYTLEVERVVRLCWVVPDPNFLTPGTYIS